MDSINNYKIVRPDLLNQDGHQTFVRNDIFITDTYPDKWRQCQLFKVDLKNDTVDKILSINSPKKFMRKSVYSYIDSDLHPRTSPSGKYVCCDVVNTGKRSLFVMNISDEIRKV